MIEKNILSQFSVNSRGSFDSENEIIAGVINNGDKYHNLKQLLLDTSNYFEIHFNDLITNIKREKRLLVFQTPNRIKISHEYTISSKLNKSDFYYLFTPSGRLDWLKIYFENERVSIADKSFVKNKIELAVQDELFLLCKKHNKSSVEVLDLIYNNLTGLPCFIEFNYTSRMQEQLSYLLVLEYYESIKPIDNQKSIISKINLPVKKILFPIIEKDIAYIYKPISTKANSWLYLNSPENFEVISSSEDKENVDFAKTEDPGIASYVIKNNDQEENKTYNFSIKIKVPQSLKIWYLSLYYINIMLLLFIGVYLIDKYDFFSSIKWLQILCITKDALVSLDENKILNICLALMAGIIATRGWLIVEETVLKNIAIKFSLMFIAFVLLSLLIIIM